MHKRTFSIFFIWLFGIVQLGFSQKIIIGGAGSHAVKITQSNQWQPNYWPDSASGRKTLNGNGMIGADLASSRFLYQASFGAKEAEIKRLSSIGFDQWIDEQIAATPSSMTKELTKIHQDVVDFYFSHSTDSSMAPLYTNFIQFNYAWWTMNQLNPDKLRQRIAFALSEILVISQFSNIEGVGMAGASYYDLLLKNAFGNYRQLLEQVTLHPAMGTYLSHLNNPKTDTVKNVNPDENYARELMQLFTIGLYELNQDGSYKLDAAQKKIPTYSQKEIKEFAKIFTGLGLSGVMPNPYVDTAYFGLNIYFADFSKQMKMYPEWHEPGPKFLLNGYVTPARQAPMQDVRDALDNLFNHKNVPPFISRLLIQRLVKSNPSPKYISRIAAVFINDGRGVRGNLAAVVKAILLDDEARECQYMLDPSNGQLREPQLKHTHFITALNVEQYYERFWNVNYDFYYQTGQMPLASRTVFNFFTPNFAPKGQIKSADLVAPEFQLYNSRTSIGYLNMANLWTIYNAPYYSWETNEPNAVLNIDELKVLARDPETLVNRLDLLFTHGNLSERTRGIIKKACYEIIDGDYKDSRVRLALYLIMISPDYNILK